jgi:hypothetical protein
MLLSWERWVKVNKTRTYISTGLDTKNVSSYSKSINLYLCTVQCNAPFDYAQPQ